jgi:hypothetical protein
MGHWQLDHYEPDPPRAIAVISWIFFVLGSVVMAFVTYIEWSMVHTQTCGPSPPSDSRMTQVIVTIVCYLAVSIPLLILLLKPRNKMQDASAVCIFLALGAGAVPFVSFVLAAFAVGMC